MENNNITTKKRILVLNYEFPPLGGGASPISYEISKGYVNFGNKVDVVTMKFKNLPKFENKDGVDIYRVSCIRSKKEMCHPWEQLSYVISAKRFLKKHLKNVKYDACHCHFIIPTGIIALWLKKNYNLDYIITSHGSDIPGYNTDRFKFLHKFTGPILKKILNNAKGAYCGSEYLANLGNKINSKTKYKVIREGFDSNKFQPQRKKNIILSTGRLLRRKGFQYLIQAVLDENIGYEVHIAGDGPMMVELKSLADMSKTKIVFRGWLDSNKREYKNLLEQSSIYVLASEKENSSVSLLEAMSAGCAVITTNVSGCPETIGNAGLLINPKDYKDLKLKLDDLISNQDKIVNLQKLALKRLNIIYDWDVVLKEYIKVL
jgi:glycosyltransferase involved in cell wall biosynthesis